jgi:separase
VSTERSERPRSYCGHGSGEALCSRERLECCAPRRAAVALLMGCSSGSREALGRFEPEGAVDGFLAAGAPLVVGNLWDVTDRDIDRLTQTVVAAIARGKRAPIASLLAEAGATSRMKALTGFAPVVYGVPPAVCAAGHN